MKEENKMVKEIKLEELEKQARELEEKVKIKKKEVFTKYNVRNLKLFLSATSFVAPFIISSVILANLTKELNLGVPFKRDDITKYKVYSLDYETGGEIMMTSEYKNKFKKLLSNHLVVFTPWQQQNGQYVRYKRDYDLDKNINLELLEAVLDEDYNYIKENLNDYQEEQQTTNHLDETVENDDRIKASLHVFDKESTLLCSETTTENVTLTFFSLFGTFFVGTAITNFRELKILDSLVDANEDYKMYQVSLESFQQELGETKQKILTLKNSKRSNIDV